MKRNRPSESMSRSVRPLTNGSIRLNGATSLEFEIRIVEPADGYQGCREGNAFVNGAIRYPPPEKPNVWQKVSIDLTQKDLSKTANIQLGLNPKNLQIAFLMKNIHFNGTPQAPQIDPVIVTDAPGNVFFQGDKPVLQMTTAVNGLTYTLLEARRSKAATGRMTARNR